PAAAVWYWVCQVGAAAGAAAVHRQTFGPDGLALPHPEALPALGIAVLEGVGTALLVLAVVGTTCRDDASRAQAPLAVGAALTVALVAVGPHTGGMLNPARYFGPALLTGQYGPWGAYLIGPLLGGMVAAAYVHFFVLEPAAKPEPREEGRPQMFDADRRAA
ncbi:MAG: aquaporin, partial [Gemmataceae bacterium]